MTLTLVAANRRLARLEARRPGWAGYPPLAPPSEAFLSQVLEMLAEAGALESPPSGARERWRDVRQALFGMDDLPAARDAGGHDVIRDRGDDTRGEQA